MGREQMVQNLIKALERNGITVKWDVETKGEEADHD
jgi:hypothetical protein